MIKITQLLTVFCTIFLLLGCDRSNEHKSYEELIADYQHLNSLLYPVTAQSKNAVWPFSDLYLSSRNNILNQLLKASQSEAEVVLLTIEQRFTERFFPWPYNTNPVLNYINTVPKIDDAALAKFIVFSQQQMSASYHDKVRLSEFELSSLRHQVNEAKALLSPYGKSFTALTQFE
ncbi:hypothetical protein, partial [Pseudoalteromonas sp.]|uniref:hypothetical protein n=1 Tax=Pseudoalteromonas sp. TaxID=53249 RepID=UPI0035621AA0